MSEREFNPERIANLLRTIKVGIANGKKTARAAGRDRNSGGRQAGAGRPEYLRSAKIPRVRGAGTTGMVGPSENCNIVH